MMNNISTIPSPASAPYWAELKDLSNDVKIELISLLSGSMVHSEPSDENASNGWASRFCGAWNDTRSAEEIVEAIRNDRTKNTHLDELGILNI